MPRPRLRDEQLRHRLLSAAIDLLESDGSAALTARTVAAAAGTSTAAVYELFGSKGGLIRSIFFAGFDRLASDLDAVPETDDASADLLSLFATTHAFAMDRPAVFEVMFERPFAEFEPGPSDRSTAERIHTRIVRAVARLLGTRQNARRTVDAAQALVALDRGLIAAELSGTLGSSVVSIRRRRRAAFAAMLTGLAAEVDAA